MGNGERFGNPIGEEALPQNEALRFEPKEEDAFPFRAGAARAKRFGKVAGGAWLAAAGGKRGA